MSLTASRAHGLLAEFGAAGVLAPADVHVAARLAELTEEADERVQLAAALAVRGPRLGHVFVDLATITETITVQTDEPVDITALPWPARETWIQAVQASPLAGEDRPLRLDGTRVYLDRYWREEESVAADLLAIADAEQPPVDSGVLSDGLSRLFAEPDTRQRHAAEAAVRHRLAVVAGGPGTGKTTTVARILALLAEQAAAAGQTPPLVALAAPTGKAAARLAEAVHEEASRLRIDEDTRSFLEGLSASTLHRLLGWRPGSHSRFMHDRQNRLPHDVVIVDETSMVSLTLMARLVESVRGDAWLVLVGDPGQLRSIEAGVVLADIVGPAAEERPAPDVPIGRGIVVLDRAHRYGTAIGTLAEAIRRGDADGALSALASTPNEIVWIPSDEPDDLGTIRARALEVGRAVVNSARAGDAGQALGALSRFRLLCAHRHGAHGVRRWNAQLETWLGEAIGDLDLDQRDYVGRPLLITENDYETGLYNGDTGVIVQAPDGLAVAAFERVSLSPLRLRAAETVYAMTIHKSQGSQFRTAAVLLPPPDSRILTRELLYTAVTRATTELIVVGTEDAIRAAVARPVARASGLRERLWPRTPAPLG